MWPESPHVHGGQFVRRALGRLSSSAVCAVGAYRRIRGRSFPSSIACRPCPWRCSSEGEWSAGTQNVTASLHSSHSEHTRCARQLPKALGTMSKLLRGLAAGYGAKKLGGGCFST